MPCASGKRSPKEGMEEAYVLQQFEQYRYRQDGRFLPALQSRRETQYPNGEIFCSDVADPVNAMVT
jgi:hypothetical protein